MTGPAVAFYYSVGSRYSYLASTQIASLERDTGARVEWIPVSSASLMAASGYKPFDGSQPSGQYDFKFRRADAEAWADFYGVPYREPADPLGLPNECALAACAALRLGAVVEFSHAFFRAHFVDGAIIRTTDDIVAVAQMAGLDAGQFREALAQKETGALHGAHVARAQRAGAFGVPTFVIGDRLFWGNDRLVLVRHALQTSAAKA